MPFYRENEASLSETSRVRVILVTGPYPSFRSFWKRMEVLISQNQMYVDHRIGGNEMSSKVMIFGTVS
jgi:hypothetical protein